MRYRAALFASFGMPALFLVIAVAFGQQRSASTYQDRVPQPGQLNQLVPNNKTVVQSFPPNNVMETAWKVEWDTERRHGLVIKSAWFKRSPETDWMQVIGDARVSELFVPYHRGSPRFWDVTQYQFELARVNADDAGAHGKLHISNNGSAQIPCVVEEVKDRGIIWKGNEGTRRGHTLLLWGCLHAANYRYIMEYGFQDDGCITFRCGATGHNLGGSEFVPHMHNTYWRVDVNLDGKEHNTAQLMERMDLPNEKNKSEVSHTPFNDGIEGGADWDAAKFTMVRVINTEKKNARGEPYSYDLMPSRQGNSRHQGKGEDCTMHDFWVTKANPSELTYKKLPDYCNGESIENTDVVLWYGSSLFHEPRSEDGIMENKQLVGVTHVGWSGFTLRPSNIFDRTPLFNYNAAGKGKMKGKDAGKDASK